MQWYTALIFFVSHCSVPASPPCTGGEAILMSCYFTYSWSLQRNHVVLRCPTSIACSACSYYIRSLMLERLWMTAVRGLLPGLCPFCSRFATVYACWKWKKNVYIHVRMPIVSNCKATRASWASFWLWWPRRSLRRWSRRQCWIYRIWGQRTTTGGSLILLSNHPSLIV